MGKCFVKTKRLGCIRIVCLQNLHSFLVTEQRRVLFARCLIPKGVHFPSQIVIDYFRNTLEEAAHAPNLFFGGLSMSDNMTDTGVVSRASKLLALYMVYVFLSGWAFLDYYYRFFGIDPRSLDIGFYDILIKGFTILFTGGGLLWPIYILLVLVPLLVEGMPQKRSYFWNLLLVPFLIVLLLLVYLVSRHSGEVRAKLDKSDKSTLPAITFQMHGCYYHGKLLFLNGDTYFIHGVNHIPILDPKSVCQEKGGELELSVYRAADLNEVKIIEHD